MGLVDALYEDSSGLFRDFIRGDKVWRAWGIGGLGVCGFQLGFVGPGFRSLGIPGWGGLLQNELLEDHGV